jgi:hypothetical protein
VGVVGVVGCCTGAATGVVVEAGGGVVVVVGGGDGDGLGVGAGFGVGSCVGLLGGGECGVEDCDDELTGCETNDAAEPGLTWTTAWCTTTRFPGAVR